MTVEDCREVLKFAIKLRERNGEMREAFALLEVLCDIDRQNAPVVQPVEAA